MGHDSRAHGERPPSEAGASGGGIRPSSPLSEHSPMEERWGKHPGLAHDLATSLYHHRTDSAGSGGGMWWLEGPASLPIAGIAVGDRSQQN